jgi:hypothetical protein
MEQVEAETQIQEAVVVLAVITEPGQMQVLMVGCTAGQKE